MSGFQTRWLEQYAAFPLNEQQYTLKVILNLEYANLFQAQPILGYFEVTGLLHQCRFTKSPLAPGNF